MQFSSQEIQMQSKDRKLPLIFWSDYDYLKIDRLVTYGKNMFYNRKSEESVILSKRPVSRIAHLKNISNEKKTSVRVIIIPLLIKGYPKKSWTLNDPYSCKGNLPSPEYFFSYIWLQLAPWFFNLAVFVIIFNKKRGQGLSFDQRWIPLTQGYIVPCLIKICPLVLVKIF